MKLIFLDVDGVLNDYHWIKHAPRTGIEEHLDPSRIALLDEIVHRVPDVTIVVSSTWRHGRTPEMFAEMLGRKGASELLQSRILYRTGYRNDGCRGLEIKEWLDLRSEAIEAIVILDDEEYDIMDHYPFELVKTEFSHPAGKHTVTGERGGLQRKHVEEVVKRLSRR